MQLLNYIDWKFRRDITEIDVTVILGLVPQDNENSNSFWLSKKGTVSSKKLSLNEKKNYKNNQICDILLFFSVVL